MAEVLTEAVVGEVEYIRDAWRITGTSEVIRLRHYDREQDKCRVYISTRNGILELGYQSLFISMCLADVITDLMEDRRISRSLRGNSIRHHFCKTTLDICYATFNLSRFKELVEEILVRYGLWKPRKVLEIQSPKQPAKPAAEMTPEEKKAAHEAALDHRRDVTLLRQSRLEKRRQETLAELKSFRGGIETTLANLESRIGELASDSKASSLAMNLGVMSMKINEVAKLDPKVDSLAMNLGVLSTKVNALEEKQNEILSYVRQQTKLVGLLLNRLDMLNANNAGKDAILPTRDEAEIVPNVPEAIETKDEKSV